MSVWKTVAVSCLVLASSSAATAAPILWDDVQNTSGAADVANGFSLVEAFNASTVNSGTESVNGVTFTNTNSLLGASFGGALSGQSSGDAGYDALLGTFNYGGGASTSLSLANGLLNPGSSYLVQVWFTDLRSQFNSRVMTYGDGEANNVDLNASGDGSPQLGQFAIGRFTADASFQDLTLATNGFSNAHINAYQVREIPVPATFALFGLGLLGLAGIAVRRNRATVPAGA